VLPTYISVPIDAALAKSLLFRLSLTSWVKVEPLSMDLCVLAGSQQKMFVPSDINESIEVVVVLI